MSSINWSGFRLGVLSMYLLILPCAPSFAQVNVQINAQGKTVEAAKGALTVDAASPDAGIDGLETIPADTSRAILRQFKADNPDAHEHKLGLVSEAFTEDASNPALKLERMWAGSKGTLLEVTGLPREGQSNSAAIAPETLRLTNLKTGRMAKLLAVEGVAQVLDQRGGKALLLKAGDTMYLQMETIDDLQPMSLNYTGWDHKEAKYFDRIDPRFRERYDAAHKLASSPNATPAQMKDFLVEFGKNDPDKKAPQVFIALINKMRAQNTFEGYYQAYLLVKNPEDARKATQLARTDEHRTKMENMAVATLVDKARLLSFDFSLQPSSTSGGDEVNSGGILGSWFNALRGKSSIKVARRPISGVLRGQLAGKRPVPLTQGEYAFNFSITAVAPGSGAARGFVSGGNGNRQEKLTGTATLRMSASNPSAQVAVNLGQMEMAYLDRGSMGGYTARWLTGDGRIEVRLVSVELIK